MELMVPDALERITKHISCGGTLRQLCNELRLRYGDVIHWIQSDPERQESYERATAAREQWIKEGLHDQLAATAMFDLGELYDATGELLPIPEWPESARRTVQQVNVSEKGTTVRMPDRLKALELMGKAYGIWKDRVEHDHQISFSETVRQAQQRALSQTKPEPPQQVLEAKVVPHPPQHKEQPHSDAQQALPAKPATPKG